MYEIREFKNSDYDQLLKLWIDVVKEHNHSDWIDEIKELGIKEYVKILVLTENQNIIGSIAYKKIDSQTAEIKRFYVYKNHRGKGLASKLYENIFQIIKKENYKKIKVETWSDFPSGINFYKKNNFKLIFRENKVYQFMLEL